MKNILFYISFLFLISCESEEIYNCKANKNSKNLTFYAGIIFYNETVLIRYNGNLILKHTMDSVKGYQCYREFFIPYTDKFTISISTILNGKTYIDTTITIDKRSDFGYHINISRSVPFNWKDYFEDGKPEPTKQWGYLPIDSCIRFVTFDSDTVYKNTWTDEVN